MALFGGCVLFGWGGCLFHLRDRGHPGRPWLDEVPMWGRLKVLHVEAGSDLHSIGGGYPEQERSRDKGEQGFSKGQEKGRHGWGGLGLFRDRLRLRRFLGSIRLLQLHIQLLQLPFQLLQFLLRLEGTELGFHLHLLDLHHADGSEVEDGPDEEARDRFSKGKNQCAHTRDC